MGDVTKVSYKNGVLYWDGGQQQTKIDLILAGSPCQGFSFAGKQLNFNDDRSRLFFDFIRIKKELEAENPKLKFLLENVRMSKESEAVISRFCSIEPIFMNSKLLSAQSRPRLYWTNIGTNKNNLFGIEQPGINQPKDKGILLKDILQSDVNEKYFLSEKTIKYYVEKTQKQIIKGNGFRFEPSDGNNKSKCLTAGCFKLRIDENYVRTNKKIRRLTPGECLRLQTIPKKHAELLLNSGLSDTQLYKMAGNGWTVEVISYILKHL